MNAGQLKHRITIERSVMQKDVNGFDIVVFNPLKTVWAAVNNLFGKEYWSAKEYACENTAEFTIRHSACKDISVTDRINFRGKLYNISSIDNVLYKNNFVKIKAMEVEK